MLCGNKEITVVHILSPGDYQTLHASDCSWRKESKQMLTGTVINSIDSTSVRIPLKENLIVRKGDIFILGNVFVEKSLSIGQILERFPEAFVASEVNYNDCGSDYIKHIHVSG